MKKRKISIKEGMKGSFLFLSILLVVSRVHADWVHTGMTSGTVASLTSNGTRIFAGEFGGVQVSTNDGTTWTLTSLNQSVVSFTVNSPRIFAGSQFAQGIFISSDNGSSWVQTPLNNEVINALATNGSNIFAGSGGYSFGAFISSDNGTSWTHSSLNAGVVKSFAINNPYIFAGETYSGVYVSSDNGLNWTQTALNNQSVYSLTVNGSNVFAGTFGYGVYVSANNGTTWVQSPLNNRYVYALTSSGPNIFAGTNIGVYVSTNNGTTWTLRNENLAESYIFSLMITNNYVYAGGQTTGVWRRQLYELTGINPVSNKIPGHYSLFQNYPNPFNPSSKIKFQIVKYGEVQLKIYDLLGRDVATLVNEKLNPGTYELEWNASNYSGGVYFYKLMVEEPAQRTQYRETTPGLVFSETKRMVLIK